jgi:F5/8 type C domain
MRKRVTANPAPRDVGSPDQAFLDVEHLAQVEVTSEDGAHPVEAALVSGAESGWRAAAPGEQTIRLVFDAPQRLTRMWLLFVEPDAARTQEFVLRWSADGGRTYREIVRQQWNFAPPGTIREAEDYRVELSGVTALELRIIPDKSGGDARASLAQWRLAG